MAGPAAASPGQLLSCPHTDHPKITSTITPKREREERRNKKV